MSAKDWQLWDQVYGQAQRGVASLRVVVATGCDLMLMLQGTDFLLLPCSFSIAWLNQCVGDVKSTF